MLPPSGPDPFARVGRRGVLGAGGVVVTAAALQATPGGREVLTALGFGEGPHSKISQNFPKNVRVEQVRRPGDLLALDLVLIGLRIRTVGERTFLESVDKDRPGYLAFVLPGQNIGESLPSPGTQAVSATAIALPSILAFRVPEGWRAIYDLETLLAWTGLRAVFAGSPGVPVTRVEAPYRLVVTPSSRAVWQHATRPVRRVLGGATTEVWHTRLTGTTPGTGTPDQRSTTYRTVRAGSALPTKLNMPLTPGQRAQIVKKSVSVAPVVVDRLMLSSLGATLELHGRWPDTTGLLAWDHRSTLGRDQYVKTVESGFLAPWGHRAAKVTETWRVMAVRNGHPVAVQQSFETIVLLDPLVDTSVESARAAGGGAVAGCALPFQSVRATVAVTGRLASVVDGQVPNLYGTTTALQLPFVGRDWTGSEVPFVSRVMWIASSSADKTAWSGLAPTPRTVDLGGQRAAITTEGAGGVGSTTMPVGPMVVDVVGLSPAQIASDPKRAPFRPIVALLRVQVPALRALAAPVFGQAGADHVYHPSFLADEANVGGIVLAVATSTATSVAGETTGGIIPAPAYQGFSTKGGAILASSPLALDGVADGFFHPGHVFEGITLLGGISLADIVVGVEGGSRRRRGPTSPLPPGLPQLTHEVVDGRETVRMTIRPTLRARSLYIVEDVELRFVPGELSIDVVSATGGTGPAERRVDARLTGATLQLGGLVVLPIDELRLASGTGHPLDVTFRTGHVEFLGELAFVQQLALMVAELLGDGGGEARRTTSVGRGLEPDVTVGPDGVRVGLSLALPDVAVGVFNLSGLGFGLGVTIGLASPSFVVDFDFATHDNPFVLTYGPFGGGGYVALRMRGGEIDDLEVSLLVAGVLGLNLGVAAGAISVQAGFVLALPSASPLSVVAFFRASGSLEVLGLVSLSVVFEIALQFVDTEPSTLTGSATLQLKVKVLCCSKTVKAGVTRTFAGGATGHPVGEPPPEVRAARRREPTAIDAPPDGRVRFRDTYADQASYALFTDAFAPGQAGR